MRFWAARAHAPGRRRGRPAPAGRRRRARSPDWPSRSRSAIWVPTGDQQFDFPNSWADFLKTHPGWTNEIVWDTSNVKFVTSVAAGDAPDVFMQPSLFLLDAAEGHDQAAGRADRP